MRSSTPTAQRASKRKSSRLDVILSSRWISAHSSPSFNRWSFRGFAATKRITFFCIHPDFAHPSDVARLSSVITVGATPHSLGFVVLSPLYVPFVARLAKTTQRALDELDRPYAPGAIEDRFMPTAQVALDGLHGRVPDRCLASIKRVVTELAKDTGELPTG